MGFVVKKGIFRKPPFFFLGSCLAFMARAFFFLSFFFVNGCGLDPLRSKRGLNFMWGCVGISFEPLLLVILKI